MIRLNSLIFLFFLLNNFSLKRIDNDLWNMDIYMYIYHQFMIKWEAIYYSFSSIDSAAKLIYVMSYI